MEYKTADVVKTSRLRCLEKLRQLYKKHKITALDNLEYIEAYFNEELSPEEKKEFEQRIISDPVFAEEVAFYLSSKQAAAAEMTERKGKV